ncbi:E3 ubiquitin-protein ligase PPP1R11 [Bacillus rossius redtenbacheri]|uniref:E3 ubiquitin-protein ligase PPP1R11 n=1 Tax=Bacillus rossius redtenbacheri TaxID=93214 RepID=UPI002FDD9882
MSEQEKRPPASSEVTVTLCESEEERAQQDVPTVRLRLRKPKPKKKVQWGEGTVDNEHMNKKKSKCCCIYTKQRVFGESSSDTDDECENCHGHVERRRKDPPEPQGPPQDGAEPDKSQEN